MFQKTIIFYRLTDNELKKPGLTALSKHSIVTKLRPWKWKGLWWASWTSNPVEGVIIVFGGFDSHALPPFIKC
jgi:hypothetical protein